MKQSGEIKKTVSLGGWQKCTNIDCDDNCTILWIYSNSLNYVLWQRRQWHPTPVLLLGKSHGRRSLVGCSPWVAKSWTRLSDFTFTFHFHALEKEMATHSSVLAWRIPGTGGEPGGLPSMGTHRVGHDWSDLAAAQQVSSLCFSFHLLKMNKISSFRLI